jgi:hypothetical protein
MNEKEFEEMLKGMEDCPAELLDLMESSQSTWRKGVIKQFILDHIWKQNMEGKIKWINREQAAIIALLVALLLIICKMALGV